jgi:hypothetical protein
MRREIFAGIYPQGRYPGNTLVVVDQLARAEWMIEVEATAALPLKRTAKSPPNCLNFQFFLSPGRHPTDVRLHRVHNGCPQERKKNH